MKFKSQVYTQASGSIGGITYSHNAGGMYTRARAIPTNPATAQQTTIRTAMAFLVGAWSDILNASERSGWDVYGANVTVLDPFGDPIHISGINHYCRSNVPRIQAALTRVDTPPTIFNTGFMSEPGCSSIDAGTDLAQVTFSEDDAWVDEDGAAMLVWAGRPQNPTINFFKGPYRYSGLIAGNLAVPPTTPAALACPFDMTAGQFGWFRGRVTRADGRLTVAAGFRQAVT